MLPPPKLTTKKSRTQLGLAQTPDNEEIDPDIAEIEAEKEQATQQNEDDSDDDVFAERQVNFSTQDEKPNRKRLAELLENPYPNKHRGQASLADPELTPEQVQAAYRQLDRGCRWLSFLYMTSNFHHNLIIKVYGQFCGDEGLDTDGDLYVSARDKVMKTIKGWKSKVCTKFMVCPLFSIFSIFCMFCFILLY
jgi:hypothetical protein